MNLTLACAALVASLLRGTSPVGWGQGSANDVYKSVPPAVVTVRTDRGSGTGFVVDPLPSSAYSQTWRPDLKTALQAAGIVPSSVSTEQLDRELESKSFVLTAYHVIEGASSIEVVTRSGKTYRPTHIYGYDQDEDVAVLLVGETLTLSPLRLNDEASTEIGAEVFVVGNPLGVLENSLSSGILSAKRTVDGVPMIQYTAPISPGNSGSPVVLRDGSVIGMVVSTIKEGQQLNFGLAASALRRALLRGSRVTPYASLPVRATGAQIASKDEATSGKEELTVEEISYAFGTLMNTIWSANQQWFYGTMRDIKNEIYTGSNARYAVWGQRVPSSILELTVNQLAAVLAADGLNVTEVEAALKTIHDAAFDFALKEATVMVDRQFPGATSSSEWDSHLNAFKKALQRLTDAVDALFNLLSDSTSFSWSAFGRGLDWPVAYLQAGAILVYRDDFVWPDVGFRATARVALDTGAVREGDTIVGIRKVRDVLFSHVRSWKDVVAWIVANGSDVDCEVKLLRDGREVTVRLKTKLSDTRLLRALDLKR